MKTIRRKIPARDVVRYQCEVCGTKYKSRLAAVECEKRTLEEKKFLVGQAVSAVEKRICLSFDNKEYVASGLVKKILGPMLPDVDYEIRHLGGDPQRTSSHVFWYRVWFICPHCGQRQKHQFYAPELEAVKIKKK